MSRGGSRGRGIRAVPVTSSNTMAPPSATSETTTTTTSANNTTTESSINKRLSMAKIFGHNSIESPEQRQAFLQWCKSMEIFVHAEVHLGVDIKGMGRGVVAGAALKKGTSILLVPQRALLSPHDPLSGSEAHRTSPVVPLLHDALKRSATPKVNDFTRVVLRFMSEVSRRRQSPWYSWIAMCPVMGSAIWELPKECHEGTDVGHALDDKDVLAQWDLVKAIVEANPTCFVPPMNTYQLYLQCVSQVASRNFYLEYHEADADMPNGPFLKLVPVVDFLNHSHDVNAVLKMHGGRGRAPLQLELLTSKDIEAGEQLMFSYSDISSGRFLAEFQFVPHHLPHDSVRISQQQLIEFCSKAAKLEVSDVMERVKQLDNGNIIYREGIFVPDLRYSTQPLSSANPMTGKSKINNNKNIKNDDDDEDEDDENDDEPNNNKKDHHHHHSREDDDEIVRQRSGNLAKEEIEDIEVWNTIALLTLPKKEFASFFPTFQKWWRCDRKAEYMKSMVTNILGRRIAMAIECERACTEKIPEAKKKDEETKAGVDSAVAPVLFGLIDQYRREQTIMTLFMEKTVDGFNSKTTKEKEEEKK